ncbi:seminal metalloprotease 1-like [Drosophila novamexicana]|uniref:seminal metalloprotease 1-like n=1 Tax=Drosophila novamexicana TaxID=47314 RepID=UPI0011E5AE40|nr:seminal metalloprotease 1-like [Drosophila novamexicana]
MFAMRTTIGYLLLGSLSWNVFAVPINPDNTFGLYQGDMAVGFKRNGLLSPDEHWPNGEVYYKIDEQFKPEHVDHIKLAMQIIQNVSCVRFLPAVEDTKNFVEIKVSLSGCWSNVGFLGGKQTLSLPDQGVNQGCFRLGTIQHELLHTLGFLHQQSSPDRDDYVQIAWDNIQPDNISNFQKYNSSRVGNFGATYDYGSIMHYSVSAFKKTAGLDTITPLQSLNGRRMGQRNRMSDADITRLNNMYKCNNHTEISNVTAKAIEEKTDPPMETTQF